VNENLDWAEPAELYVSIASLRLGNARYRRFSSTAEAIRFAIEELPVATLRSMAIESGDTRYEGVQIRALYDALDYPLQRPTR
jgi:hypothetical protein